MSGSLIQSFCRGQPRQHHFVVIYHVLKTTMIRYLCIYLQCTASIGIVLSHLDRFRFWALRGQRLGSRELAFAMAEFELLLLTAFSLGVLLTFCFQRLFSGNAQPRDDRDDDGHQRLYLPEVLYVSRAGKSFHLDQCCFSIPKKNEVVDLQCCKHCLNSSLKKRKAK